MDFGIFSTKGQSTNQLVLESMLEPHEESGKPCRAATAARPLGARRGGRPGARSARSAPGHLFFDVAQAPAAAGLHLLPCACAKTFQSDFTSVVSLPIFDVVDTVDFILLVVTFLVHNVWSI